VTQPELGTTWEQAIENAYRYGYNEYSGDQVYREIKQQMREHRKETDENMAILFAINDPQFDATIHGGMAHKNLWDAIDEFFEKHMPTPVTEQYQREAVVAEDLSVAYEAGVYDALLGNERDTGRVEKLTNYKPTVDDTV